MSSLMSSPNLYDSETPEIPGGFKQCDETAKLVPRPGTLMTRICIIKQAPEERGSGFKFNLYIILNISGLHSPLLPRNFLTTQVSWKETYSI